MKCSFDYFCDWLLCFRHDSSDLNLISCPLLHIFDQAWPIGPGGTRAPRERQTTTRPSLRPAKTTETHDVIEYASLSLYIYIGERDKREREEREKRERERE